MRIPRPIAPIPAALLSFVLALQPAPVAAQAPASVDAVPGGPVDEVLDCVKQNTPEQSSVQIVEFTAVDRIGGERVSRAKILAKRFAADSMRRVLLRFTKPLEVRGSALLAIEQDSGSPDMFVYTTEMRKTKRVTGQAGGGKLFGTDFSYEDFARWQGLNQPGASRRLPDAVESGQPVWVVETRPEKEEESGYERVVFFIDQETCVALKTESYERGDTPRKILTADPEQLLEEGGVWFASELTMRDLRDETHTQVVVEDVEVDRGLRDSDLSLSKLERRR